MGDEFHKGPQESRGTPFEKQGNPKHQPGAEVTMTQDGIGYPQADSRNAEAKKGRPEPDEDVPKGYVRNEGRGAPGGVQCVNEMGSGTLKRVDGGSYRD